MIRFINLKDQIIEGANEFAFYDTVTDSFCRFSGSQRWSSVEEFKQDYDGDDLQRFLRLISHNWQLPDISIYINGSIIDELKPTEIHSDMADAFSAAFGSINHWDCGLRGKWQRIGLLEQQLKQALVYEDYLKADEIKKQIENLKDGSKS